MSENKRYRITVTGIVQGVGFRPFVYTKAKSLSLNGWVINVSDGVIIEVEGADKNLDGFVTALEKEAPPLALIKSINVVEAEVAGYTNFEIRQSSETEETNIYISPDVSVCEDCKREMLDPDDRRYLYPFINCTNCGPRFTIIKGVPYDRVNTTMNEFPMCGQCAEEYNNPLDRRYHAQPVACSKCGPKPTLLDNKLNDVAGSDALKCAIQLLIGGKIVAIKGLGGYHLACDANNEEAVKTLRRRKIRDDKPFAVMMKDSKAVQSYCQLNEHERLLLESPKKPIVLLGKSTDYSLPEEIAPGNPNLGVMLPYTPVHELLFACLDTHKKKINNFTPNSQLKSDNRQLTALVMTSANRSNEPIYYKDEEAFENLKEIADYFLTNDREIFIRTDDSVTRSFEGNEFVIRRSRGYVPMPVTYDIMPVLNTIDIPSVLACGGELKNTFCMNKGREFFLSHHIGDLENIETLSSFEDGIRHFENMFKIKYDVLVHDLHPEYLSTKYAMDANAGLKLAVQHHHAHIASCMAENNLNEDVIGVAFDGTGYGEDGKLWGGEFFVGNYKGFKRVGHLDYVGMPGGEAVIKEPWRMALGYIHKHDKDLNILPSINSCKSCMLDSIDKSRISIVLQMLERSLNSPFTSSMGRLFDAVAALAGVRSSINYEGQAAIELEQMADKTVTDTYSFSFGEGLSGEPFVISVEETIAGIIMDLQKNISVRHISGKFHETAANIVLESCLRIRKETDLGTVVLSGGVFQNLTLLTKVLCKLRNSGFRPFIHSKVPSNDGGIALGQAVMGIFRAT